MKIEKVLVKDFRSHEYTKVGFAGGINLLIGQNGSGKSSLLDAILIGLYWPARPKDLKKDSFLRVGGKSSEITVFFEKDGVKYQIHRNITRGIAHVKYFENGKWHTLEINQKKVRDWMEKMIPYDVFVNAIYIRQGEIDAILESDESREKIVRKVLGLDRYENAYKNLLEVRKVIDSQIKGIEAYLNSMKNIDGMIKEAEEDLKATLKALNDLSPKIPALRKEVGEIAEELKKLDELAEKINTLTSMEKEKEGTLKEVRAKISGLLSSIEERKKRLRELEKKGERLREIKPQAEEYRELAGFY
ncbi:AAA family ATPase [Thermococcus sp.]